jgi:hypothetical protein
VFMKSSSQIPAAAAARVSRRWSRRTGRPPIRSSSVRPSTRAHRNASTGRRWDEAQAIGSASTRHRPRMSRTGTTSFGRVRPESGRCGMNAFTDDPHHTEDLHAWQVLRPLLDKGNYLPWSTGTMRPAGLVRVCNEIVHRGRTRIVECGSGVSTVVLARLLRQRGWRCHHRGARTRRAMGRDRHGHAAARIAARHRACPTRAIAGRPTLVRPLGPDRDARSRRSSRGRRAPRRRPWTRPAPRASPNGLRTSADQDGNRHPRRCQSTRRTRGAHLLAGRDAMAFHGRPSSRCGNRPTRPSHLTACSSDRGSRCHVGPVRAHRTVSRPSRHTHAETST